MSNGGLNVLFDALDNEGIYALDQHAEQTPDDPMMITAGAKHDQGIVYARDLKRRYQNKTVLYRRYPDDHQYERIPNPLHWLDQYGPLSDGGLYVCDQNESGIGNLPRQADWMAANIENLCSRGGLIAFWHINTHNPPAQLLPLLRPAFEAAGLYPEQAIGCGHWYFDLWNDDGFNYLVAAQDYAKSIGCIFPWAVTELGYGHEIDPYIGFQHQLARNAGVTDELYGGLLVHKLGRLAKRGIKGFVYAFGDPPPWGDFDVRRTKVLPILVSYSTEAVPVLMPEWKRYRLTPKDATQPVNVRKAQATGTTPVVAQIPAAGGEGLLDVSREQPPEVPDDRWWHHVQVENLQGVMAEGWVRADTVYDPVEVVADVDPAPPFDLPFPTIDPDPENAAIIADYLTWLAQVVRQRGARKVN